MEHILFLVIDFEGLSTRPSYKRSSSTAILIQQFIKLHVPMQQRSLFLQQFVTIRVLTEQFATILVFAAIRHYICPPQVYHSTQLKPDLLFMRHIQV